MRRLGLNNIMREKYSLNFTIPFDFKYLSSIDEKIKKFFSILNINSSVEEALIFNINLALTEAIVNAIKHGESDKKHEKIRVIMEFDGNNITINVHSKGNPFDIHNITKPDPLSDSGRGLYVISNMMDKIDLQNIDGENILIMKKNVD
jgi:serine/threonine-protein kinase RsbW